MVISINEIGGVVGIRAAIWRRIATAHMMTIEIGKLRLNIRGLIAVAES